MNTPDERGGRQKNATVRALAWDPTGPAALSLCPVPGASSPSPSSSGLDVFLSHDGTGCPPEEAECLLRCLDAREEWAERQQERRRILHKSSGGSSSPSSRRGGDEGGSASSSLAKLSKDYRAALCECLVRLTDKEENNAENKNQDDEMKDEDEGDDNDEEGGNNLELLELTYAVSHLAEIFLLPSSSSSSSALASDYSNDSVFHNDDARGGGGGGGVASRLDGPAGSITADVVRYLRLHHTAGSSLESSPAIARMLESDQPEYYPFPSSSSSSRDDDDDDDAADDDVEEVFEGPYDRPYWNVLLRLAEQGQLHDAWTLLSHHSACRRAQEEAVAREEEEGGNDNGGMSPEGEGFATLRALLLSAPIPGGRGDGYCDDAGLDDCTEDDDDDEGEDEDEQGAAAVGAGEFPEDIDQVLVDGVPPNAYLLWEPHPRRADGMRSLRRRRDMRRRGIVPEEEDDDVGSSLSPPLPESYQPRAASNAFRTWQETVRVVAFPSAGGGAGDEERGGSALSPLFRRFPPLSQILSVLLGETPPAIIAGHRTWSRTLLSELLYARPGTMPEDVAARARAAVTEGGGGGGAMEEIVLSVMEGGAGRVVETLFSLCGGASGAALPAAVTSLLCNLLVDAGCISPCRDPASSSPNVQTELLLLAAESVLSSFAVQEQSEVGVRTAVRLLLPHAPPRRAPRDGTAAGAGDVVHEPRIAAAIAEALSHRPPATDAEARDLLDLCEDVVRLGSVDVADACESLAFARATHHRRPVDGGPNPTREVYWLLRGMEVLSCWPPEGRRRTLGFACRRRFDSLCEGSANDLISVLSVAAIANFSENAEKEKREEEMSSILRAAEDVLEGVLKDDVMAPALKGHVEANLLQYAVDVALADARGDAARAASDVVRCLEERRFSEGDHGGVASTLADPRTYSDFLGIAFALLAEEESSQHGQPMEFAESVFTVHGMHVLMARLTQVLSWEGIICSSHGPSLKEPSSIKKEYFAAMRLAFSKGLMRAFVAHGASNAMTTANKTMRGEVSLDEELDLLLSPCI